jgi:hypothetical protein
LSSLKDQGGDDEEAAEAARTAAVDQANRPVRATQPLSPRGLDAKPVAVWEGSARKSRRRAANLE